ncbi:hypothetical protein J6590_076421 [Homalodisca vitripennis]|nr:hypothetical protein J6590_076421 [Homalodisca vitripennis]
MCGGGLQHTFYRIASHVANTLAQGNSPNFNSANLKIAKLDSVIIIVTRKVLVHKVSPQCLQFVEQRAVKYAQRSIFHARFVDIQIPKITSSPNETPKRDSERRKFQMQPIVTEVRDKCGGGLQHTFYRIASHVANTLAQGNSPNFNSANLKIVRLT